MRRGPDDVSLPTVAPLTLIQQPTAFSDPDWLFEVKHDGFRSLAYIQDECRLVSRKGNTYQRFKDLSKVLSGVPHETVLDGELVCLDEEGQTLFYDLMFNRAPAHFYAFDILWLDGEDLRDRPILERKEILQGVISESPQRLLYVDHIKEQGEQLFDLICGRDMEGIVAKPSQSPYREQRGKTPWIKIKNPEYSQVEGRGELFHPPGESK